ncbi:HxlR family transcriptional regulator [Leptospira hartskeerlii]|uniref:HxlR family transcriptional regulator n=1 Tax=Leptospira hartskeerlii TaxID=2023177 RepID=A0A2M9XBY9_9LEPT|nr:helix-turn-helix domain-containing protein [Leptospira hartskeerlii]PJZ25231.1 HxlR family transcriptional regulator [Leptospira hartskeerlii]PJZ33623.1 HxlR family transcriptional regulator [Leptospira hartskeerlii]
MNKNNRSHCPIVFALDIFGDKWSLLVLRDLIFKDKRFFKEFLESEERIATNILSDRLEQLEFAGLISKRSDETNRKRYIYSPTRKSLDLIPVILEIIKWSAKYDPKTETPADFLEQAALPGKKFEKQIRKKFQL